VREILDGGDTWVFRITSSGRGIRSGAPAQWNFSAVFRFDPLVIDERTFLDDADALREAGFSPVAQDAAPSHA
jgi:hypothetical protein